MNALDYSGRLFFGDTDVWDNAYACVAFGGFNELRPRMIGTKSSVSTPISPTPCSTRAR